MVLVWVCDVGARGGRVRPYYLGQIFKQRERIVVVDHANTFYVSPPLTFQEAKELHAQQSTFATIVRLDRNPKGFDQEDLLKQRFLKHAFEKASALRLGEEPEFKASTETRDQQN